MIGSDSIVAHLMLIVEERRSFSARWRGRFKAARRKDDRYKALAEKYL